MTDLRLQIAKELTDEQLLLVQAGTEHSVALAFRSEYRDKLVYDHHTQKWLIWDGKCWILDSKRLVQSFCRKVATLTSDNKSAQRISFVRGVESFSQSDPAFARHSGEFDADNYLLNTQDGVIDLRTGEVRPHDPQLMITNITPVSIGRDYGTRFPQFLKEITMDDLELEKFLQVSLGATLSGAIEDHWLMFWRGSGRNGKNTLGDAVANVLGTYARKIPSTVLMKTKHEGHPTEIAQLKGCRMAVASEVEATAFWSESKMKELTGDEMLSARFMRGDFFNFKKTFKFLIYGNHRPRLSSIDEAIRSRIKIVWFKADFSKNPDPNLPAKLREEYQNILRWLIDGHLEWYRNGKRLPKCQAVEDELDDYLEAQATVENWIDEYLDSGFLVTWTKASTLYESYKQWKESRGEQAVSQTVWADAMMSRFKRKKANIGIVYSAQTKRSISSVVGLKYGEHRE
jgi:putative DNA primase/helicase